jgi:hypothetical protein
MWCVFPGLSTVPARLKGKGYGWIEKECPPVFNLNSSKPMATRIIVSPQSWRHSGCEKKLLIPFHRT